MSSVKFSRHWAMPNANTFSIPPIGLFVERYLAASKVSVDPFARDYCKATWNNDLDPASKAQYHMDAETFCLYLHGHGVEADLLIFDPPYSPRQLSECYKNIGKEVGTEETQNGRLYKRVRDAAMKILIPGSIVLSFGWNTVGMGINRGFKIIEIQLVCHGGAHNDTVCLAEQKE